MAEIRKWKSDRGVYPDRLPGSAAKQLGIALVAPGGSYPSLPFDVSMNRPLTARYGLDSNSRSMEAETATKAEKLVGKYFHGVNESNKVEWQGVVIGEPNPGWYYYSTGLQASQACKDLCPSKKCMPGYFILIAMR